MAAMPFDEQIRYYAARHRLTEGDAEFMIGLLRAALAEQRQKDAKIVLDGGDGTDRQETAIAYGPNAAIAEAILAQGG